MTERTIFLQALERASGAERTSFLSSVCGDDDVLRRRVEELLHSHEDAGSFLASPVVAGATSEATPGSATETHPPELAPDDEPPDFLAPSDKPDSLGRLDHYDVLNVVGRGGMGIVLRAFDEKLHRVVALKVMTRDIAGSAAARKRFSREAKAAAAVVHDHIVPIHAIEEAGPTPYLVMQFIEGKSLQQKIDAEGSLELKEILRIGMQIASGLSAAHKQGLVHRDIKPSNILLENGVQRVKITDFGLARAVDDSSVSQSGIVAGTPQYMSPEQADGQAIDHRSDLFSLGSVMYAMCTGRPPFRSASTVATLKRVCEDTPRPIRELNPEMPEWLSEIIARLHAKKPAERFQSAKEVAEVLEQRLAAIQNGSFPDLPKAVRSGDGHRARPPFVLLHVCMTALAACSAFIAILANRAPDDQARIYFGIGAALGVAAVSLGLYRFVTARQRSAKPRDTSMQQGSAKSQGRWRAAGWLAAIGLGIVAVAVWGNAASRIKRHFYRELTVKTPDLKTVVQFWETTDTDPAAPHRTHVGNWPLEPRITVANTREQRFKLAPARYWMVATRDGKQIEERLLTIGWGGQEELTISHSAEPNSLREAAASIPELQKLVTLAESRFGMTRQQHQAGAVSASALVESEIEWMEAKLKLAGAQQKAATEMNRLYAGVVQKREELLYQFRVRHEAGLIAQSEVNNAEKQLSEARLRLTEAQNSGTAGQGVLILKFESAGYSSKVREFGAIVQLRDATGKIAREIAVKPGSQVSTTVQPGEYTIQVSDATELELSRQRLTMTSDGEETVTLRTKPHAGSEQP